MSAFALATDVQADAILPRILPALIALFVLIVVGTFVLTALRRSLRPKETDPAEGFTLHGLRRMHARGDLTDEEFARAKAAVIERTRGVSSGNAGKTPGSSDTTSTERSADGDGDGTRDERREYPDNL